MALTHVARVPKGERPLGYSPKESRPPGARLPTMSGVPPHPVWGPEARRRYYESVAARPPKPPRPLQPPLSREQRIWRHCEREAVREIECLVRGQVYRWQGFEEGRDR